MKSNEDNTLKLDLHVHSHYSGDAQGSPEQIIKKLIKKGIHGASITDHNTVEGSLKALKVKPKDFIIIPGVEISTADGHFIALGIKENIPRNLPVEETLEKILDMGGIPVVPHLFRKMSGIKENKLKKIHKRLSAMEVFNSCSLPKTNKRTSKIAKKYNLGGTGGSDSHQPEYAGYGYTVIKNSERNVDSILSAIRKKQTWGEGKTLPLEIRKNRMIKSIKQYFQRGFTRI